MKRKPTHYTFSSVHSIDFFLISDALFFCEQHHNSSTTSIVWCSMAEMDSLDVDVDKLWLHGDHVNDSMIKHRVEQLIQDMGYHVTGMIQYNEPRSVIICFDTKKLAGTAVLLPILAR